MSEKDERETVEVKSAVAREVAEAEFERFTQYWDIHTDSEAMTVESREDFDIKRANIIRLIRSGDVTIDEKGKLTYRLIFSEIAVPELCFAVPTGAAYVSFDRYKDRQNMAKTFEMLGAMTGQPPKTFSNLDGRDVKFCMGMLALFMAS
jgi:hypothetical protein